MMKGLGLAIALLLASATALPALALRDQLVCTLRSDMEAVLQAWRRDPAAGYQLFSRLTHLPGADAQPRCQQVAVAYVDLGSAGNNVYLDLARGTAYRLLAVEYVDSAPPYTRHTGFTFIDWLRDGTRL